MKRVVALGVVVAAVAVFAVPAAADAPPGSGLVVETTFTCNGSSEPATIVHPSGATGWIDGQHVVILEFRFEGPQGTFVKSSGNKSGLSATYTCVGVDEANGVTLTILAAPVPPG